MSAMEPRAEGEYNLPYELPLDAIPSRRHKSLLESYKMNLERGSDAVYDMIVGDLERFIELGAQQRAADRTPRITDLLTPLASRRRFSGGFLVVERRP